MGLQAVCKALPGSLLGRLCVLLLLLPVVVAHLEYTDLVRQLLRTLLVLYVREALFVK